MCKAFVRQEEKDKYSVFWIIRLGGEVGCTDYWETWVIRNIYFIETRAKKQNSNLLSALHVHRLRIKDPDFFTEDFVRALGSKSRCVQHISLGL